MKIWHDDIRRPPDDTWTWARTNDEAKGLFQEHEVEAISMDHDLGHHDKDPDEESAILLRGHSEDNGYELAKWMAENGFVPEQITIHSWNPSGAERIAWALRDHCPNEIIVQPYKV
jgi:hypothetical protein